MLNRLQIYDTNIKEDNFSAGRHVDLSATCVLSGLMRSQSYDIDDQRRRLKVVILRHQGIISTTGVPSSELIEQEWEILLEKFLRDPTYSPVLQSSITLKPFLSRFTKSWWS
jgi:hypothetical protein